jgi:hypothetical protein
VWRDATFPTLIDSGHTRQTPREIIAYRVFAHIHTLYYDYYSFVLLKEVALGEELRVDK